jgi:hypothetical protein
MTTMRVTQVVSTTHQTLFDLNDLYISFFSQININKLNEGRNKFYKISMGKIMFVVEMATHDVFYEISSLQSYQINNYTLISEIFSPLKALKPI